MIFKIIWNEIKKEFFTAWSYKWQWLGELFSLLIFFTFLSIITKNIESGMAYCIWFYSILIIGEVSSKVSSEMRTGTFEQLYLSSVSSTIIFMSKAIASILRASILVIILLMIFWSLGIVTSDFLKIKL